MSFPKRARVGIVLAVAIAASACFDFGGLGGDGSAPSDDGGSSDVATTDGSASDAARTDGGAEAGRPEPATKVVAEGATTCTLRSGVVKCWGNNDFGQVGNGSVDSNPHATPAVVSGIPFTPTMITTSGNHTCVSDGTHTSCWGRDDVNQLGQAASPGAGCISSNCPVPVAADLVALRDVQAGFNFTCFTSTGGAVSCFGDNASGVAGATSLGGVVTSPQAIFGVSNVVSMGVGEGAACARQSDGTVWCWGENFLGDLGQKTSDAGGGADNAAHPTPLQVPGIVSSELGVGQLGGCAVLADSTVTCWGSDSNASALTGQLGHDPTTDSKCETSYTCDPTPTPVATLANVREVSEGYIATCAVRTDDTVVCWGDNSTGLLNSAPNVGSGLDPYNFTPQVMPGLTNIAHVAVGARHACAVSWDDHLVCWGLNSSGELGVPVETDGGANFSRTPVTPQGF